MPTPKTGSVASAASPTNAIPGRAAGRILFGISSLPISSDTRSAPRELRTIGELFDHSAVRCLGIGTELGQPRVVGNGRDHGDVVLVGKDGGAVRIEHPDSGLALRRTYATPVGEVDEAVVWAHAGGNPSQSSERRVTPVGGHGERRGERAAPMVRAFDLDAVDPVPIAVAEHANDRLAGEVLDARRFEREPAHDRIEASTSDSVAGGCVSRKPQPTPVRRPGRRPASHGARLLE